MAETVYRGPDYLAAVRGDWGPPDPLLHPDPHHPPRLYRWVVAVFRFLLPLIFRVRIVGRENVPRGQAYILASNHQAWYDPALILLALPDAGVPMLYSMARRDTVFNRGWKRAIVRRLGVFPIAPHEGELDLTGLASVYHVLSRGGRVLIFPEGRYSRGRRLRPLKKGVAHFALQAGVPILPIAIDGLERLRPFGKVTISIGQPIHPDPPAWWNPSRRVLRVLERLQASIVALFDRPPKAPSDRVLARLRRRLAGLYGRARGRGGEPAANAPPDR